MSGLSDPIQWRCLNRRNSGTIVTWLGNIIVEITNRKTARCPRHLMTDSAYATGTEETTTPTVAKPA